MIYTILIFLLIGAIVFGIFEWLGWIVGIFNPSLNSKQRRDAGLTEIGFGWSKPADFPDNDGKSRGRFV